MKRLKAQPETPGVASVVIVNYRGADDTRAALAALREVRWPRERLEVIVVDNASGDGSVERITKEHPDVRVIALDHNRGFAAGCNAGAQAATGEYLAFLNNDARPDTGWLASATAVLDRDGSVACVASKVLDWDGELVDFVDAGLGFYGHGFKLHAGEPDSPAYDREADVLFASGAAMVVRAATFREVGGFDERYFLFFEDVDLGWRLWLLGYRVRYVPDSLTFHRHHRSAGALAPAQEEFLLERNALFTIFKNYDDENLRRALPAAVMLAVRRGAVRGGDDAGVLDPQRRAPATAPDADDRLDVDPRTVAPTYAVDAFVEALPALDGERRALQAARRRADHEITRLFRLPLFSNVGDPEFTASFSAVVDALGVERIVSNRRRIAILTGDVLEPKMAGPAIRAWHMACTLAREHDVQLASTQECSLWHPDFPVRVVDERELEDLEAWCDVLVFQGNLMRQHPVLRDTQKIVVTDIYDPFHLEVLEQARNLDPPARLLAVQSSTDVLNEQLRRGDFFLCASDKQRDFWLGQLASVGRINPATYDRGENLEGLLAVAPFGVSDEPPRHVRSVLRGVVPGIGDDDKVVLWGGGIYNWFDPLTLLRAVDKLRRRLPEVRLYFLGLRHPNPQVGEMKMADDAVALAEELGLVGTNVFFNEDWVEYDDRQNYLLESDIGVSTHLDHVETEFSFRTRLLDYLWASLPIVATAGDSLAALIESSDIGVTVPAGDVDALEAALFRLLDDEELNRSCRTAIERVVPSYRWSTVLEPLLEFCRAPSRAPDLVDPETAAMVGSLQTGMWDRIGWRADLRKALRFARRREWGALRAKLRQRFSPRPR
ncbi:MAG TPA: glycosyltransferase [Acidimicrobiia bacterium]|nr:glycosyltransferase [Acidimicrobiia bacterium]